VFIGYLFAFLAMLSIGVLGILSKYADIRGCTPLNTALVLFGGSTALMGSYVSLVQKESLIPPRMVGGTAVFFGVLAVLAFWIFLYGLQFGKITSSWIFMNLSAIVPASLSMIMYHEKINALKAMILGLVVLSIFLLWKDKQQESEQLEGRVEAPARANAKIWIIAMLCAFLLNGICPFGLRVLAGRGLAHQYAPVYLVYWYLAGFIFGLAGLIKVRRSLSLANLIIGLIMAVASVGGQFFMGQALSDSVPGSVVYMLGMGASMCVVVLGGVFLFGEKVGAHAKLGIVTGLVAAVLLGITG
jgi:drug/metabolite transporter (DMT)-like permease